ncbi:metal ABC transporter solute-binding protein, Zn/Mn family [Brumimicrobium aurantiacum]|uniref:Manganese transporter n=1 Tax=Brumimicrobium aurantiacum TaxID=1737063 RepID=A0A3E1EYS5_9FLAO|nr:zinc ABC transporter substrate-binding protein [Brumimicrobium aurantiacum]RFC54721.1 manganese transporter [Brumimicrobium aurantiacum]
MKIIFVFALLSAVIMGCENGQDKSENDLLNVVTTTTMITDLVQQIGAEKVNVDGLMGAGVDPHLFKASEGDVAKLAGADLVFYNGLHLEGKLVDVFERMKSQNIKTVAIADTLEHSKLIKSALFESNYDPHIWFDIANWKKISVFVANRLSVEDSKNADYYKENATEYLTQLNDLQKEIATNISSLTKDERRLVTAHDAFNYFGQAYAFDVVGLQGLSTATEAGVQDVQKTAAYIIDHKVKAIFIESSVPQRTVEALKAAVNSKGHEVSIGGTLYSDALGDQNSAEGTYIGMFKYNVNTIVNALK